MTFSPNHPLLASYQPDLRSLRFSSGTMKAICDNVRAIDLLSSLPYVDRRGFGVIGHSLGGHNAIYTAVFDRRLAVVVTSCGFDSFVDYKDGALNNWTRDRYMPRMGQYLGNPQSVPFDFHELLAALAPRPCFINAPLHDSNFKSASVDRVVAAARTVYAVFDRAGAIKTVHPDCAHDFPPEVRQQACAFIEEHLEYPVVQTYCNTDRAGRAVSAVSGGIRYVFYDPEWPPASLGFIMDGVGREGCSVSLDMIAVPLPKP
ncbi:MAG: hypothetical protein ACREIA_22975 [Opitutaceae bacterium]